MSKNDAILSELKAIKKILLLTNATRVEDEILKIANTDTRKKMWILINGIRMPVEIAKKVEVTPMAVSHFLNAASTAGLIKYIPRKPPVRLLDYVPPSWLEEVEET